MCRQNSRSVVDANPDSTQVDWGGRALNIGRTTHKSEVRESKSWPLAAIFDRRNVNFSLPIETHLRGVGAFILYRLKPDTGPANLNWPRAEMRQDLPRVRVAFRRNSVGTRSNFGGRNRASHSGPPPFCHAEGVGLAESSNQYAHTSCGVASKLAHTEGWRVHPLHLLSFQANTALAERTAHRPAPARPAKHARFPVGNGASFMAGHTLTPKPLRTDKRQPEHNLRKSILKKNSLRYIFSGVLAY